MGRRIESELTHALTEYGLLNLDSDPGFERIVRLAARLFDAPTVLITLMDDETIWFKARVGFEGISVPRENTFCDHVIRTRSTLVLPDASKDPRFANGPYVTGETALRFYAGAPLLTPEGQAIGTICVIDSKPRLALWPAEREMLEDVALLVRDRLELRRELLRSKATARRAELIERLLSVTADAPDFVGALTAAAGILREATGGQVCVVWQLDPTQEQASVMVASGREEFETADYLAKLRDLNLTPENSQTCRSLFSQRQLIVRSLGASDSVTWPTYALARAHGLVAQILTPMSLLGERYAFVVGFGQVDDDFDATAQLLLDATSALLPLLRRHRDDEVTRLFHRAVEASSDPVVITEVRPGATPGERITYVNPAFERETGYAAPEVIGRSPDILHGPGTSALAVARIRSAHEGCNPLRQEILQYNKTGGWASVELNIAPVRDLAGQCTHFVAVHRDVTERNRVERLRMENSLELEALMSAMPGALMRLVPENGGWPVTYIAPSIEALTGYPAADLKPGDLKARIHAADLPMLRAQLHLAMELGHSTAEIGFRHRDGRDRVFFSQMRGNFKADGTHEVIMSWTDLTREREMTAHLAQTVKLAQLGELAAGMAHEMNQPLAGISLAAENALRSLVRRPEALPRVQQKLELIVDLASRASSVIDHMRVFGRTGSGPSGRVNLAEVLAGATRLLQGKLLDSGVQLMSDIPADLPPLLGKAVPLEQVFINLIANACDAYVETARTPAGKRRIWVKAAAVDQQVLISVRDEAGGMAPDVLARVFEPFFTTKQAGHGTGLGLSISYGIITDMAGDLTAASSGVETTFTIGLPSAPVPDPGPAVIGAHDRH